MNPKRECIAMLLAGGQGSRLGVLTQTIAKPAVPYGGKYRIIDFPLSNCVNSGIDTVGVLTQYQPLELSDYIGSGQPWDLDRADGGVHILSPYQQIAGTSWYKNTANAIYQNITFIERYAPQYVLILSGDHIYKMNYAKMLDYHKEKDAACTIAMLEVPWEEASRFGLMSADEDGRILEFEEKPANPKTNTASMGVYVFTWEKLRDYLIADENNPQSGNDFGHDLIPAMHTAGERLFGYRYSGYWKDVGTIDSLWEANLDLLNPNVNIQADDAKWRIYYKNTPAPPQYIAPCAQAQNCLISEGCEVSGEVDYSVLFSNVTVEEGASVRYSILMPGAVVKRGARVHTAIVAENAVIGEGASVGASSEEMSAAGRLEDWGVCVVGKGVSVEPGAVVAPKEMVDEDRRNAQ
ncbi:MAG: glucose-1-phosphate adenylyltransferase [Oscillospiraceae bacterium]|jgi:glucose-1-phosphate adenylyltransferase|nr:glucose-1-phosphate adenylyltransferase [Oscillospiraceae bacterium]